MKSTIKTLNDLAPLADYSFLNALNADPQAKEDGNDHHPREVFSGHFVPVNPTPIENPHYVAHSKKLFAELGFSDTLATSSAFMKMFSADTSNLPKPLKKQGWATGYALSIYGREYYEQCPFRTGNAYGDGRAISIFETLIEGKRWEMQLKGGGRTPYCRGADGRAVLRSSIREFLAQEHMEALNIPTSRSLTLYASSTEKVQRPWFHNGSYSKDPELMIEEAVAITTRVAPSFLRVGQVELFARRTRKKEHPNAHTELEQIVLHLMEREYAKEINLALPLEEKILLLAQAFRKRLTSLVANWIRVGFCQGNFNSDNTALGGFTLDYGPFGFMDMFDPSYQPWTGGGVHFSFLNQPQAAQRNFEMFCLALKPLLASDTEAEEKLEKIKNEFAKVMQIRMIKMWSSKLGLETFDAKLFNEMIELMLASSVDYTIFFRELSSMPKDITPLTKSFYEQSVLLNKALMSQWSQWLEKWKLAINVSTAQEQEIRSKQMKSVNPKYTLREWFLVPAYQKAVQGNYRLIHELQEVMNNPYDEQSDEIATKYYAKKPMELFDIAGVSHVSCSS